MQTIAVAIADLQLAQALFAAAPKDKRILDLLQDAAKLIQQEIDHPTGQDVLGPR